MEKVLFVATVDSHILNFHVPYLKYFKDVGHEVHVVTNGNADIPYVDRRFTISVQRSPFDKRNIQAYKQLKNIIDDQGYQLIHCHTPMGGVLTRFAARRVRKNGTKVLYTAHGFHFYKGAPMQNWLFYFPVEWLLSFFTDCLITINQEDYQRAKRTLHAKRTEFVHGVGLDPERFILLKASAERHAYRRTLGLADDDFVLLFVGELNKNQDRLIELFPRIQKSILNCKLLLAGTGRDREKLEGLIVKLRLEESISLLGWRSDIPQLLSCADVYVSLSSREGLPMNIVEALYAGLPVIATNIRGHRDLIKNGINGFLCDPDASMVSKKIIDLHIDSIRRKEISLRASISIDMHLLENVTMEMNTIYNCFIRDNGSNTLQHNMKETTKWKW